MAWYGPAARLETLGVIVVAIIIVGAAAVGYTDGMPSATKSPMGVRPIRNDRDHRAALAEIEACWGAPDGTEAGDRLDLLVALVESYEAGRWPIGDDEGGASPPP